MEATIYNTQGKKAGTISLPENMFGVKFNADMVHQVITAMQANARTPVAHTKDRGEVRGGGKKPWKQKGTGRARHGSSRSPIWAGGGVAHGPRNDKDYSQKVNKKTRAKALFTLLSAKYRDGETIFVDTIANEGKTKDAVHALTGLAGVKGFEKITTKPDNAALIVLPEADAKTSRAYRNIGNVLVRTVSGLNPVLLAQYRHVVIADPAKTIAALESKMEAHKLTPATK